MKSRNKNVEAKSKFNSKKPGFQKPPLYQRPFQKPGFPISFLKSISGFSQKPDYKQRFHERNSHNGSRTIDVCDENIEELKESIKKSGNPEKYIISKISNRKKNDVTESVIGIYIDIIYLLYYLFNIYFIVYLLYFLFNIYFIVLFIILYIYIYIFFFGIHLINYII